MEKLANVSQNYIIPIMTGDGCVVMFRPESHGFGLAFNGLGFQNLQARPKPSMKVWLWLES
jgi:hypothetical protein